MESILIKKENVIKAFNAASEDEKNLLKNLFDERIFPNGKITDRVKTFDDACAIEGINPESVLIKPNPNDLFPQEIEVLINIQ